MKKIYIITLFLITAFTMNAQRFDWAKGYTVYDEGARPVVGAVTDSMGNLYLLGYCDASSTWDGNGYILPSISKQSAKGVPLDIVIAKISTEGELVWKKVIFANNEQNSIPLDIKKIGDSAFACLVKFTMPSTYNYTYYLDTLLYGNVDYPIDTRYFQSQYLSYLVFDFNGDIKEQHFMTITYTDAEGNDFVQHYPDGVDTTPWLIGVGSFFHPSFDIDNEGNIFIGRIAYDRCDRGGYAITTGDSIRGLKFWVDRHLVGEYRIQGFPSSWYPQLMKFSPHFDTLLECRYVIQNWSRDHDPCNISVKVDMYGNIYFMSNYQINFQNIDTIVFDSIEEVEIINKVGHLSFLTKYDPNFNTLWAITFDDSLINESLAFAVSKKIHDIDFDYDSNLVFLYATSLRSAAGDTVNYISTLSYRGDALPLKDGSFVASFYNTDTTPVMHSFGLVPAKKFSCVYDYSSRNRIRCKNNRVFMQCAYYGGLMLPSRTISYNTLYHSGFGMIMFDYNGHVIDGIDYGIVTMNVQNNAGPIALHDSVLYLCSNLGSTPTFGSIHYPVFDRANVIARYVDTAFMHPYVRPTHGINTVTAAAPRVFPVPASDRLHYDSPDGLPAQEVAAISLFGVATPLPATATTADISRLAPGLYLLEITTAKGKYHTKFIKR